MNDKALTLSKEYKIRSSQAITPFGVGAIVDFRRQSLMAASTEFWDISKADAIHDERLERVLNVDSFYIPRDIDRDEYFGFPFVNFPEWYFCPKCRRFKSLKDWEIDFLGKRVNKDKKAMIDPKCSKCNLPLVPARIICICSRGHIQDFPWDAWTHYKSKKSDKTICSNPSLEISTRGASTGLEGISIKCVNCNASATLQGSFSKGAFEEIINKLENTDQNEEYAEFFKCKGNMPWALRKEKCSEEDNLVVVQRGASNTHYTKILSSIVIPPYSNKISVDIENHDLYHAMVRELSDEDENDYNEYFESKFALKKVRMISDDIRFDYDEVLKIIRRKLMKSDKEAYDEIEYKTEEYKAITGQIKVQNQNETDFKVRSTNVEDYRLDFLTKVVLIEKLREVRALVGFTRLLPPDNKHFDSEEVLRESTIVSTKTKNWYPAYEVRGEGIFIEFDLNKITEWASNKKVRTRIESINLRSKEQLKKRNLPMREISPEFVLLHTFAHLLIKQLSFDCGYSSASLRERIYFNKGNDSMRMCGILIYTASGDSEGTLGGLIRQGYSDKLPQIILKALTNATWCSNDPVCIESSGQGRDSMNLAACYACSLVSETSCEEFNVFLDRGLLIGTLGDKEIGFFNGYV